MTSKKKKTQLVWLVKDSKQKVWNLWKTPRDKTTSHWHTATPVERLPAYIALKALAHSNWFLAFFISLLQKPSQNHMARRELVDSCNDFLELKPHHASLLDLVRVLFSTHDSLSRRNFVETSDANHLKGLGLRWIVFISLFVQKLLLYLSKPVARMGYVIEMWLNLLSSNGGFCQLLSNILKGLVLCLLLLNHFLPAYIHSLEKKIIFFCFIIYKPSCAQSKLKQLKEDERR